MDLEIINRKTRVVKRTMKDVVDIKNIPSGYRRLSFKSGSCKINNNTFEIRQIAEKR